MNVYNFKLFLKLFFQMIIVRWQCVQQHRMKYVFFILKSISGIISRLYIPLNEKALFVANIILLQSLPDIICNLSYHKWYVKSTFSYGFKQVVTYSLIKLVSALIQRENAVCASHIHLAASLDDIKPLRQLLHTSPNSVVFSSVATNRIPPASTIPSA